MTTTEFMSGYGFVPCQSAILCTFYDRSGFGYNSYPAYNHPALDAYVTVIDGHLNSRLTLLAALEALYRLPAERSEMDVDDCRWELSAANLSTVQRSLAPANFAIFFTSPPDDPTSKLIRKYKLKIDDASSFHDFVAEVQRQRASDIHPDYVAAEQRSFDVAKRARAVRYADFFGHSCLVNFTNWRTNETFKNIHAGAS